MNNSSLKTCSRDPQTDTTMLEEGWRGIEAGEELIIARHAIQCPRGENPVFFSQIFFLPLVENIQSFCKSVWRWGKIREGGLTFFLSLGENILDSVAKDLHSCERKREREGFSWYPLCLLALTFALRWVEVKHNDLKAKLSVKRNAVVMNKGFPLLTKLWTKTFLGHLWLQPAVLIQFPFLP